MTARNRTLRIRCTEAEEREIKTRAQAAGHADYSSWLRELALGDQEQEDGRARRWAAFRATLRRVLREQPDDALWLLTEDVGATARTGALRLVARLLELDRELSPQEAGIVADVAHAERLAREEASDDGA